MALNANRLTDDIASVVQTDRVDPAAETVHKAKAAISEDREKSGGGRKTTEERKRDRKIRDARAKVDAEVKRLFAPENWEAMVRAPADLAMAVTSDKCFNMSDAEVKTLSQTCATAASYFIVTDPKYLALIMFSVNFATVYGGMIAQHVNNRKKDKKNNPEK